MSTASFSYSFETHQSPAAVFELLLNPERWWSGVYGETITGASSKPGDIFSFTAGGGAHHSLQELTAAVPGKKIEWLVTESNLSFLNEKEEWTGTRIRFEMDTKNEKTIVLFTHEGLLPTIECYDACSNGWMQYLTRLKASLQ